MLCSRSKVWVHGDKCSIVSQGSIESSLARAEVMLLHVRSDFGAQHWVWVRLARTRPKSRSITSLVAEGAHHERYVHFRLEVETYIKMHSMITMDRAAAGRARVGVSPVYMQ